MAIAFVKEALNNITIANPGPTANVSVTNAPGAGNLLILSMGMNQSAISLSSVTDSRGNTWTVDQQQTNSNTTLDVAVASTLQNVAALQAADTITLHFSVALTGQAAVTVHEFSGCSKTIDQAVQQATAGSTGTARDAGTTAATTSANDLVWAALAVVGGETSFTPGAGYSTPTTAFYAQSTNISIEFEYQIVSATGVQHPTGTGGLSARSIGVTVAYQQVGSSGSGVNKNTTLDAGLVLGV